VAGMDTVFGVDIHWIVVFGGVLFPGYSFRCCSKELATRKHSGRGRPDLGDLCGILLVIFNLVTKSE
jgi:hypothetical protein